MSPQPQEDLTPAIRIVPHVDGPRSLRFDIIEREVPDGVVIKIGRFTDKALVANRVTFKSKVVSRGHAEIWSEGNKFFIRDTKSSSGTFLNHSRLSTPGAESKAFQLNDGDIVQLGVDYQGGTEEIYRCVKMRIELNRSWKRKINNFSLNALKDFTQLMGPEAYKQQKKDCPICLCGIGPCQALFLTPCSHLFHYKCIKHEIDKCYPGFMCPVCRGSADLDEPIENITGWEMPDEQEEVAKKGVEESTSAKKEQTIEQTTKNEIQITRPKSTSQLIENRPSSIEERSNLIGRSSTISSSVTPNSFAVPIPGNKKTSNSSEDGDDQNIMLSKTLPSSPPPIPGMSFIDEGIDSGPSSPTNQHHLLREQGETPRLGEIAEEDEGSMSSSSLNPLGRNQIHQTTSFQEPSLSSASASDNDDDAVLIGLQQLDVNVQSDDSRAKGKGVDRFGMGRKGEDVL